MSETPRFESRIFSQPFLSRRRRMRAPAAYIRLLRLPGILTAFADVVAGSLVGTIPSGTYPSLWAVGWLVVASGCIYAAGMVLNDAFDLEEDALDRPERPLPSGAVKLKGAVFLASALLAIGLTAAAASGKAVAFYIALAIALLVVLYDGYAKRLRHVGPPVMASLRSLNLRMGASVGSGLACGWHLEYILGPALVLCAYTLGLSLLAECETSERRARAAFWAAAGFTVVLLAAVFFLRPANPFSRAALCLLLAALLAKSFVAAKAPPGVLRRRHGSKAPLRSLVGSGIIGIIALDAAFVLAWWQPALAGVPHSWLIGTLGALMLMSVIPVSMLAKIEPFASLT